MIGEKCFKEKCKKMMCPTLLCPLGTEEDASLPSCTFVGFGTESDLCYFWVSIYLLALTLYLTFTLLCQVCWLIPMRTYRGGLPRESCQTGSGFFFISDNFF